MHHKENGEPSEDAEEAKANAKLIAAAPESHDANLISLAVFAEIEELITNEKSLNASCIAGISRCIEANHKAIKKATE